MTTTGSDMTAAGSDMTTTGIDMAATGSDMTAAGSDMTAAGNDAAATGSDTAATGSDTADLVTKVKSDDDLLPVHDVSYFRQLLVSETKRLTAVSEKWNEIITSTDHLSEEGGCHCRTAPINQSSLKIYHTNEAFSAVFFYPYCKLNLTITDELTY